MEITQGLLREIFDYKDGFLYWKKPRPKIVVGSKAGALMTSGIEVRRRIKVNGKSYLSSRLIFLYHNGYLPEMVDHRDRDTLNDRIENLRAASKFENARNRNPERESTSKYLGVALRTYYQKYKYWAAQISTNKKCKHLGLFKTEEAAALAYNKAAVMFHKEFANLNIITPPAIVEAVEVEIAVVV